jgi:anti-anti-sigma factor
MKTRTGLRIRTQDDVTVIHVPPECIDPFDVAKARDQWNTYIKQVQPTKVVVDFDAVRMCSSETVGGLVNLAKTIRGYGGDIKLCSMSVRTREIFDICKMIPTVFELYHSTGEAIDSFEGSTTSAKPSGMHGRSFRD